MRVVAATLVVAAALLLVGTPAVTGSASGCATATGPHAALVVDTGSRSSAYCVSLDASSVSGIHLIQLAAGQHGLSYGLGFGGQAVCRLLGVGPTGDDCFADYPRYWGYWHGDGHDGWTWSSTGAGSATIHSGDVDGWVWGAGDSGSTHPSPPRIGIDAVCAATAPSSPPPSPPAPPATTGGPASVPAPTATGSSPARSSSGPRRARPSPVKATATVTPRLTTPTPNVQIVAGGPPPDAPGGSGIPPGIPLAVALAIVFAAGGVWRARSRKGMHP